MHDILIYNFKDSVKVKTFVLFQTEFKTPWWVDVQCLSWINLIVMMMNIIGWGGNTPNIGTFSGSIWPKWVRYFSHKLIQCMTKPMREFCGLLFYGLCTYIDTYLVFTVWSYNVLFFRFCFALNVFSLRRSEWFGGLCQFVQLLRAAPR